VLAFDAHNEEAVTALRELDRQRELRRASERSARARLVAQANGSRIPSRSTRDAREFDLEQSLELLRAGDTTGALPELRRYVAANRGDRAARARIASAVYAQAQRLEGQGSFEAAVGMYAEAIGMHAAAPREWSSQLGALKMRLAGAEYEKGVRLLATDVGAAIPHFEAALRFAPDHTQAQLQLQRARKIQQNLRSIGPAKTAP
jgi:tetratricopeptide (TPR) repeat protein